MHDNILVGKRMTPKEQTYIQMYIKITEVSLSVVGTDCFMKISL